MLQVTKVDEQVMCELDGEAENVSFVFFMCNAKDW